LARNDLLRSVLGRPLEPRGVFARYLFLDPLSRERIINWSEFAELTITSLRLEIGRRPNDLILRHLIDELRSADQDVARWWDDNTVRDYSSVAKRIMHPIVGELEFDIDIVSGTNNRDQRLVIYTAQPDSRTALMLPILSSWDADVSGSLVETESRQPVTRVHVIARSDGVAHRKNL